MPQPNFFILGAPKCGTTSLAGWLGEHPQIYMSPIKEPHYYSSDLGNRKITTERAYSALFKKSGEHHAALGEASTWYLYSRVAVANIERAYSKPRYIVLVRDPVDMAVSLYYHNRRQLYEDAETFEEAWRLQAKRRQGEAIPRRCPDPNYLLYLDASALGTLVTRLLKTVEQERVLVLSLNSLKDAPSASFNRVLDFLGVARSDRRRFPVMNEAAGYKNRTLQKFLKPAANFRVKLGIQKGFGVSRLNARRIEKQPLDAEMHEQLRISFAQEQQKLEEIVHDINL